MITPYFWRQLRLSNLTAILGAVAVLLTATASGHAGEADLAIPDLHEGHFTSLGGLSAWWLLFLGAWVICGTLGISLYLRTQIHRLPAHRSMLNVADTIYATCKTYLIQQGKFLLMLFVLIACAIGYYLLGFSQEAGVKEAASAEQITPITTLILVLLFSIVGMGGSYAVAWYGIRVNTYANCRTAFASLRGKPWDVVNIPLRAGMSVGLFLISLELVMMVIILLFVPRQIVGYCFLGFAIGESLGASALRIAGGIFTKIADIGSDLMKIVFKVKEDDPRNPGVIADCTGDNAGDSVGPTADGFETYGVTGVALITFILLGVRDPVIKLQLLVWIFVIRIVMLIAAAAAYYINAAIARARYAHAERMNFEMPLTTLVWITSFASIGLTYLVSAFIVPNLGGDPTMWWKLSTLVSCGTLAGALIPELVKVFTSTESRHVKEVMASAREGGASLDILSGFVAGNYSSYYLGLVMVILMAVGYA